MTSSHSTDPKTKTFNRNRIFLVVALVLALGSGLLYRFLPNNQEHVALPTGLVEERILQSLKTPQLQANYTVHQTIKLLSVLIIRLRPRDYAQQDDPVEFLFVSGLPSELETKLLDPAFLNDTANTDVISFMVGQYLKLKSKGKTKRVELANIKAENTQHTIANHPVLTGQTVLRLHKVDPKNSNVIAVRGALIPWEPNITTPTNTGIGTGINSRIYLIAYRRAAHAVLDDLKTLTSQLQNNTP